MCGVVCRAWMGHFSEVLVPELLDCFCQQYCHTTESEDEPYLFNPEFGIRQMHLAHTNMNFVQACINEFE